MIGYLGVFLSVASSALIAFKRIKSGYVINAISCLIMVYYNAEKDPIQTALFVCYSIFALVGVYNYTIKGGK